MIVLPSHYLLPLPIFTLSFCRSTVMLILSLLVFQFTWILEIFLIQGLDDHNSFLSIFPTITVHQKKNTRFIVQISHIMLFYFVKRWWKSVSVSRFSSYTHSFCDRRDLVEYCIKQEMLMQMCKYVKRDHQKKSQSGVFSQWELTDDKNSEGLESQKYWYNTWHKFLLLICFSGSWNGFWQLRVMLAEYEGQRSFRSVLFGWNSRLHGAYSFLPQHGVSFSPQSDAKNIHQNPSNRFVLLDNAVPILVFIQLLASFTFDSFPRFTSTSHIFAAANIRPPSVWWALK